MIRFAVIEFVLLGLCWLFARNLSRASKGKIHYSGSNIAARKKQPKTFWFIVGFNTLMLALMIFGAIDFALKNAAIF